MNEKKRKCCNCNIKPISKIKSDSGVTILFALLVLLVCVVVASVILTASTAASGRTSQLEKMDQRYYSVTSAVDFIRDAFSDKELQIDRYEKLTTVEVTTTTQTGTGDISSTTKTKETKKYQFVYDEPEDCTFLLSDSILLYVFGNVTRADLPPFSETYSYEEGWLGEDYENFFIKNPPGISSEVSRELNLKHDTAAASGTKADKIKSEGSAFDVALSSKLKVDGDLDLTFVNNNGEKDKYSLRLRMNASSQNTENSEVVEHTLNSSSSTSGSGDSATTTVTTTETTVVVTKKTTTMKWTPGPVKKVKK